MKKLFSEHYCSLKEGTIIATLSIIIVKVLGMLYIIPFYSMIGESGSVLYSYVYNIYSIFLDISCLGIPLALCKITSEYKALNDNESINKYYVISRRLIIVSSLFIFVVLMIFSSLISKLLIGNVNTLTKISNISFAIRCISFSILIVPIFSINKNYLLGHNVVNISSISQVLEQLLKIIFLLVINFVCIYIMGIDRRISVSISMIGIMLSSLITNIYVSRYINYDNNIKFDFTIVKRLFKVAIPFIVINSVYSIYNFIDMSIVLRVLDYLKYNAFDIEYITSSISTWSYKIGMIVQSISIGLITVLIPKVSSLSILNNIKGIEDKINKSIGLVIFISLPLCIGISLLSREVWSFFYGYNYYGSSILKISIYSFLFINLYTVSTSILHSMNKYKVVYISTLCGLIINVLLDIPFMILFGYIGSIIATIVGYFFSILIILFELKNIVNLRKCFNLIIREIIPIISMIVVIIITKNFIIVDYYSKISCVINIFIIGICGGITYLFVSYKMNVLEELFEIKKMLTKGKH